MFYHKNLNFDRGIYNNTGHVVYVCSNFIRIVLKEGI